MATTMLTMMLYDGLSCGSGGTGDGIDASDSEC